MRKFFKILLPAVLLAALAFALFKFDVVNFDLLKSKEVPVIALDGTSGSGKGTIGQLIAEKLGWHYLDSGALYRIYGYALTKKGVSLDDIPMIVDIGKNLDIEFIVKPGSDQQVIFEGEDITDAIRTPEATKMASKVAAIPEVRGEVLKIQRSFRKPPGLVADGRDMGAVVFPDAKVKIFLTASLEERARRRLLQLQAKGINANLPTVLRDLEERDERDRNRAVSPLKPAVDAIIIDATMLSIDEVLQQVLAHVNNMQIK